MKNNNILNIIQLRFELHKAIDKDGEESYGGKGNATISSKNWAINRGIRVNKLLYAKN